MLWMASQRQRLPKPCGVQKIMNEYLTLDTGLFTLTDGRFCSDLVVLIPWFFLLEMRQYIIFLKKVYRCPQLRDLGFLQTPLTFKVLKNLKTVIFKNCAVF